MSSNLIFGGPVQNKFESNRAITRVEFTDMVVRALELKPGEEKGPFVDVAATAWYSGAVAAACRYGLVDNTDGSCFRPLEQMTREQAMVMLANAMRMAGRVTALTEKEIDDTLSLFDDAGEIALWAKREVAVCIRSGIIAGKSARELSPKGTISRAEAAVFVLRLIRKANLLS